MEEGRGMKKREKASGRGRGIRILKHKGNISVFQITYRNAS